MLINNEFQPELCKQHGNDIRATSNSNKPNTVGEGKLEKC
jgi:hypothetical protein